MRPSQKTRERTLQSVDGGITMIWSSRGSRREGEKITPLVETEINKSGDENSRVVTGKSCMKNHCEGEDGTAEAESQENTEILSDGTESLRGFKEQSGRRNFTNT